MSNLSKEEQFIVSCCVSTNNNKEEGEEEIRFSAPSSFYYSLLLNRWNELLHPVNWEGFIHFVHTVGTNVNVSVEFAPTEIGQLGHSTLPLCLSLGYILCVLIKKGEVAKATQLWNEVNGCFGDQCQALYFQWCFTD